VIQNEITTIQNCKYLCLDNPDTNNVWDMKIGSCEKCYSVQKNHKNCKKISKENNNFYTKNESIM